MNTQILEGRDGEQPEAYSSTETEEGLEVSARRAADGRGPKAHEGSDLLGPEDAVPTMAELETRAIKKAMRLSGGSISKAAKMLGLGRATLYRKIAAWETV